MIRQVVGDDTTALDSVLKADVWRDHLLQEEVALNAKLAELEAEGDDKRFVDAREEASLRLAEVHTRLADMEAESGPARAAGLLAGTNSVMAHLYSETTPSPTGLGFSEEDQKRPTKSFSGGWRYTALARDLWVNCLTDHQDAPCPCSRTFC